jgi:hypothetical protein
MLLARLLFACSHKRRQLTQEAIKANDLAGLKHILSYHTVAEAVLQDVHFCSHGTPLHFLVQEHPGSLSCLQHVVDRGALEASFSREGLLPVHAAVLAGRLDVLQRLVEVAAWPPEQGGGGLAPEVLVNLRTCAVTGAGEATFASDAAGSSGTGPGGVFDRTPLHLSTDEEVVTIMTTPLD